MIMSHLHLGIAEERRREEGINYDKKIRRFRDKTGIINLSGCVLGNTFLRDSWHIIIIECRY